MSVRTGYQLLSEEERSKVGTLELYGADGLYGQFPQITSIFQAHMDSIQSLFEEAEEVVLTILKADAFSGFQSYIKGPRGCILVAERLDLILKGEVRASQCLVVWSAHQKSNRNLLLVLHEDRLKLCTAEYVYQNEYMSQGVHWYRLYDDREKLECDSYRLHQVLTILSKPKTAWAYLRARVLSIEQSLNNR